MGGCAMPQPPGIFRITIEFLESVNGCAKLSWRESAGRSSLAKG